MSFIDQVLAARRVAPQEKLFNTPTGIRRDSNLLATGGVRPQVREGLLHETDVNRVGNKSQASRDAVNRTLNKVSGNEAKGITLANKTNMVTNAGRPVYKHNGEFVSEKSVTMERGGKWINVPSIHNGRMYNERELVQMLNNNTINITSSHNTHEEAISSAKQRSSTLMEDKFSSVLKSEKEKEGGYQGQLADDGNYDPTTGVLVGTNYGISAPKLAEWYGRPVTEDDMVNLDESVANQIYKEEYYDKFNIAELPDNLQDIVMNATVLNEVGGVRALQKLLKQAGAKNTSGKNKGKPLDVDDKMGSNTKEAMKNAKFTKKQFKEMYLTHLKTLDNWKVYGKGWTNRFKDLSK